MTRNVFYFFLCPNLRQIRQNGKNLGQYGPGQYNRVLQYSCAEYVIAMTNAISRMNVQSFTIGSVAPKSKMQQ